MKKQLKNKRWTDLTLAELRRETAKYDDPMYEPAAQPMPPALAARVARLKAKIEEGKRSVGRPKVGLGHKTIALSIEQGLLERADRYARKHGMTRASLVAQGLETLMKGK